MDHRTLAETLCAALKFIKATQKKRLLHYLHDNPGALTHEIARDCAIGNVACRISELNRGDLPRFGLLIEGTRAPKTYRNRFNEPCNEHRWKLVLQG